MSKREWFVSYDVTHRTIVLHHRDGSPVDISKDEAELVRDELVAALVAEHEHRILRDEA